MTPAATFQRRSPIQRQPMINDTHPQESAHEPFPGYAGEVGRHRQRDAAFTLAWAVPLPGPLRGAFCEPHTEVGGRILRAVTLGDIALLTQLDNPLIAALTAKMAGEDYAMPSDTIRLDDYEVADAAFLWSRPHAEARRLLGESPRAYKKQAMAWLSRVRQTERPPLAEQLVAHLFRSFRTSVALRAPAGEASESVIQYSESADGFGWWLSLLGAMMRDFGMSHKYALEELPLAQAFALQAWGQYTAGRGLELDTDGYISQEAQSHPAQNPSAES